MDEYEGAWLSTLSIPKFNFLSPQEADIDIRDIAHALSLTCRFGGHGKSFYSVAEHSVLVARVLASYRASPLTVYAGLLHDAEEAYLPDIPSPIKLYMPEAHAIYDRLSKAIIRKFGIQEADWVLIKDIDHRLCTTEAKALGIWNEGWANTGASLYSPIYCWTPKVAEARFLATYEELRRPE